MPRIHSVPLQSKLTKLFPSYMWEYIFPYSKVSTVFTHDQEPFWRYKDLIEAVEWLNKHENKMYHNFGTASSDDNINKLEICAFLANFNQETGWDLAVPYPYGYPKNNPQGELWEGFAGGGLAIMEGATGEVYFDIKPIFPTELVSEPLSLSDIEKKILRVPENTIGGSVRTLSTLNQPQFGLGLGTGNGAVFSKGLVSVSDDGTLWGDEPVNEKVGRVLPATEYKQDTTNRKYAALGPYAQYGGRGAIQLSYNYNYSECSLALFGDYRLARYPNLITTTDRDTFNSNSYYFGFPGPNANGNNKLPDWIKDSTPNARVLAWLTSLWFWMDNNRSGRSMSCHECMMEPTVYGITGCNLIINNDSGCSEGWAWKKNNYYKRICRIMGISESYCLQSIVCPPNSKNLKK